jgi:gluconate 5-dehydrogenase
MTEAAQNDLPQGLELFSLQEQVAVVTGAGQGLGRSMAIALAEAGASLALLDVDTDGATRTAQNLETKGGSAVSYHVDVRQPDQIKDCFDRIENELGLPSVLVNNAGVTSNSAFEQLSEADWQQVLEVNLGGVFNMSKEFGRRLIDKGSAGSLINIASISGLVGNRGGNNSHYCASKGGVIALTRSLAVEWAPHRIRVNAIAPGYFETAMTEALKARDENFYQELIGRIPLGRFGQGPDLAGAVVYLASAASAFVTGHILVLDGGYTAW